MNEVVGFNFPNIDPVALSLGPFDIRWYALAYLAGFLLGWYYCLQLAGRMPKERPNKEDIDDFLTWAIVGVILGGRLGYVLFYQPEYYLTHPAAALKVWEGGMSFHGGMLGVIISMIAFSFKRGILFLRLSDIVVCAVPIGLFFGRLANFANGELYGRPAPELPWGVRFPAGGDVLRHPSQIYEALLEGVLLFVVLLFLSKLDAVRNKPGVLAGVFLIGYGSARSFIELFREPDSYLGLLWMNLSMGQLLSLPMVLLGLGVVAFACSRQKRA